jgi:hypothetical protein
MKIDTRDPKAKVEWTDAVYVVKEDNHFVVDDMEFRGTWAYGNHGLLSKGLQCK